MKNSKKLHSCLHLGGSLKVPLADVLRKSTVKMRSAARQVADACGKSERTAANYLSGLTEIGLTDAARLARSFPEVRKFILDAITPDERSLAEDLAELQALQARVAERFREGGIDAHFLVPVDVAASGLASRSPVSASGTDQTDRGLADGSGSRMGRQAARHQNGSAASTGEGA